MKKRMLSALLALAMLCGSVPAPAFAQDLAGSDSAIVLTDTTTDEETPASTEVTEVTEATATPEPTEATEATVTPEPEATQEPEATPEPSEAPEATATPEPTEVPEATVTPEPTEVPEATVTPEPTEAPATTQEPAEQNLAVPSLLAAAAFAAADNGKSIQLADSGTAANISGAQADNIYFGNYFQSNSTTKEPVKWRVLSNSDGKLFLLSDQNLDVKPYNSSSTSITWEKSTIRSWLNGYEASENNSGTDYSSNNFIDAAFSSDEQVAIADTYVYNKNNPSYSTSGGENTTDQIFLLSIEEANNSSYFPNGKNSRKSTNTAYVASYSGMLGAGEADYWWLRSPGKDDDYAAFVDDGGVVYNNGYIVVHTNTAVRPAFNLNLNSVLFTSAAAGGKSASGMDSGLTAVGGYDGNEWKLTLLDSSRNFSVTEETASGKPGDTITLNYTGASTGDNEYISVILADDSGAQYYGRIAKPTTADGQVKITIPASLADGTYTLNVFSEQYNGGENDDTKLTDYASAFEAVTLTVDTTAPTLSNGSATRDSETTATVKFTSDEAGEYYYAVVESGATEPTDIVSGDSTNMASGENTINLTNLTAGAKDIYIVAKDAVENVSQTLKIVIPEFIPTYTISASPAALDFSNKTVGYTEAPDGQTVTITNTGNQTVTVTLPTSTNYTITAGTDFVDGTATLAPNGTATFAVQPKTGLAVGSYSETLTISSNHNTSAKVSLAFTVDPKSLDGAQVQVSGSYIYDGNAKEPSGENVTVTLDGEPLTENTDYTLSYEDNTDAGEATVKVSGKGNYSGTVTGTFQIAKATPTVSNVAVSSPETIYDTTDISSITLSHGADDTPGTVKLDDGQTLSVGEKKYNWTFTPNDTINYTTATGSIALTVVEDTVKSIAVTTPPTKTTYTYGEPLDITGMVVTATYASGATKPVTADVTVTPTELTTSVTALTIAYGELTTTQPVTVNPKEVSNPSIELSGTSFEFTGEAITPTVVSVKDGETVIPETEYTVSYSNNVNVGTNATVTITDKEGGNYTVSGSTNFQITKVKATVTKAPTANTLTYTGQPQTLVTAGTATGGTMQYSTEENGPYDTAIPTGTNVGSYSVWYKVVGDENHSDTQPMEVKVTISQASIAEAEVTLSPESFTYNGQSQTPTVTVKLNGNALTEGDYTVTYSGDSIDAGTYTVTVTGKGNYSGTADNKPTYTVTPATPTLAWSNTSQTLPYTGSQAAITAPTVTLVNNETYSGTISYQYKASGESAYTDGLPTDAGSYTVVASIAEQKNYNAATSDELTLTIEKVAASGTATAVADLTYNGQAQALVTADAVTGGTMQYSTDGSSYSADIPTGTNAGDYTVWYKVAGDANHNDTTPASVNVTIAQLPVELTWSDTTFTYNGKDQCPTAAVSNKAIETDVVNVTVSGGQTDASNSAYTATATGLTGAAAGNYTLTGCQNTTQEFTIGKATPTVSNVAVSSLETIYDTTDISSITLSHASTDTPGTVALDAGQTLTVGTRDYTWTFTPDDANNYTTATGSIALTVVEDTVKSIAVTTPPTKTTYTYGEPLDITGMVVTATCESGKTKDVTDRVTVSPETLTTSVTVLTIAYGELTTTQPITVKPKVVSNPTIELSGTSFEFTGEAITPTVVSVKDGETVIPTEEYTVSYSDNTNVGTATVTIVDVEGGNYTVSGSTTFQITKVKATVTKAPTANTLTYTGQPQTLVTAGTATGGTMQYSTEENGPYDTAIPTGTNVGSYSVWYKVVGDENHSDTQPMEVKVTISQASIAEAEVTLSPESFTYNGQSQTPTVIVKLNGNALTEGDYTVTYSGDTTNVGTVTVTVTGKGNYSGTATEKPTYTINPAPLTISGATLADKTYDGTTAATVTDVTFDGLQNGETLTLDTGYTATAVFADAGAGTDKTATVTVTLKNGNYKLASDTYQLTGQTIRKANWTGVTTAAGYVTSGQTESVKLPATPDGASYNNVATSNGVRDVAIQDGALRYTGLDTVQQGTNYTVTVNVAGGNNYNDYTVTVTLQGCKLMAADTQVKLELETVQAVPGTAFDTQQKVESELARILVEQGSGFTAGNAAFYDVSLEYSQDGGQTWIKATAGNFPAEGITVTLPYPNGTGKDTHNFRVVHMFAVTSERLGTTAGDTETPAVTKTDAGIQVTLNGLSPVAIGWSEIETGTSSSATSTPAPTATPAPDGTVYYTCPACGHHDWTATDTGYRCDTCGYVESLKQLAGYGNVKGVYEPKTGSNTAGGHAVTVPQTGDTSNPALWLGLLLLSGLALGGITLYRRKKTQ